MFIEYLNHYKLGKSNKELLLGILNADSYIAINTLGCCFNFQTA